MIDGIVGRRAGKRLHVDVDLIGLDAVGGKGLGAAAARQRLDQIHVFNALVVTRVCVAAVVDELFFVVQGFIFGDAAQ